MDLRKHLSYGTGTIHRRTDSWLQLAGPSLDLCESNNPSTNEVTRNSFIHLFSRESLPRALFRRSRSFVQGLITIRKFSWSALPICYGIYWAFGCPFEILAPSDRIKAHAYCTDLIYCSSWIIEVRYLTLDGVSIWPCLTSLDRLHLCPFWGEQREQTSGEIWFRCACDEPLLSAHPVLTSTSLTNLGKQTHLAMSEVRLM